MQDVTMANLRFDAVNKIFPDGTHAVSDISLDVEDAELMVLVGPSGCGKSTLLRLVAGLEEPSSGTIAIGERIVNGLSPQRRNVAMVFQNYALYPHKSVRQNLAFPLQMMKISRDEIAERVRHVAGLLDLEALLDRRPAALSGGQRQRVAMGRALVREPLVFLMDEPLSNLDAKLRVQMRREIVSLQERLRTTTLYVTHDQIEAMTMGDRLAVLHEGRLQQVGTPGTIYDQPANLFVATFIGSPSMNLLECLLEDAGDGALGFRFGEKLIRLGDSVLARQPALRERKGDRVVVGIRPEAFVPPEQTPAPHRVHLSAEACEELGHETLVHVRAAVSRFRFGEGGEGSNEEIGTGEETGGGRLVVRLTAATHAAPGDELVVGLDSDRCSVFDRSGPAI
jgi:multiple sugar transport system ATP-binding protein